MTQTISMNVAYNIVTMYVDTTTKALLDAMTTIPENGLAVTLTGNNTVGFGTTAAGAATDAFFGVIRSYEGANTVGVQYNNFAVNLPAKVALAKGISNLVVTNDGQVAAGGETTPFSKAFVTKASTASDLFVDVQIV